MALQLARVPLLGALLVSFFLLALPGRADPALSIKDPNGSIAWDVPGAALAFSTAAGAFEASHDLLVQGKSIGALHTQVQQLAAPAPSCSSGCSSTVYTNSPSAAILRIVETDEVDWADWAEMNVTGVVVGAGDSVSIEYAAGGINHQCADLEQYRCHVVTRVLGTTGGGVDVEPSVALRSLTGTWYFTNRASISGIVVTPGTWSFRVQVRSGAPGPVDSSEESDWSSRHLQVMVTSSG